MAFLSKSVKKMMGGSNSVAIPKGYLAVYVGVNKKKRFVVPIAALNQPSFQELLREAEQEFGFNHPMGALTLPCTEHVFTRVISSFNLF